ncbi:MAG: glycosyltransferase family 4 protein [Candidatus Omnitrophica bacterium]|nr:glycosyltransferase family 4 protein [Candidatus Omnitrophota bacterium]
MNILFLSTHVNTGGITSYLLTLCRGLRKRKHNVWLVSSGGNKEEDFRQIGVHVHSINIKTKSELSPKIYAALKPIKKIIDEHNIEVIHAQTRVTQIMAQILSRRANRIFVATCHGFFKVRWLRKLFPCWGDNTIAISPAVYQHLIEDFKVPGDRVVLIPNGIDLDQFHKANDEERKINRQKFNLNQEPVIGIIARLSDVKGIDILISALPKVLIRFPDAKLLIFGEGKEERFLKQHVHDLNLNKNVFFYPSVDNMSNTLSLFNVFVMPSRQEGLGLSVMEAQACGCCVIGSRVGGIPSLIQDGQTGFLVEPGNADELSEKIIMALTDREMSEKIGENGRQFILNNFSSDIMVEKTINLYLRLMV